MMFVRRAVALACALLIAGCAGFAKIEPGPASVAGEMQITPSQAWNQFNHTSIPSHMTVWTIDGLAIDRLQLIGAVDDGTSIFRAASGQSSRSVFRASMRAEEVLDLFKADITSNGSSFELLKLDPARFVGASGFRFEYLTVRKHDNVRMRGLVYGAIVREKLYAIHFAAPTLEFYPRLSPQIDVMATSARLR